MILLITVRQSTYLPTGGLIVSDISMDTVTLLIKPNQPEIKELLMLKWAYHRIIPKC